MLEAYQQELTHYCKTMVLLFMLVTLVLFIVILFARKSYKEDHDKSTRSIIIGCAVVIVIAVVVSGNLIYETASDIHNQDYIVYEGNFETSKSSLGCSVTIVDESGEKISLSSPSERFYGKSSGRIIYGKKTQRIVDFWITG